MTYQELAQLVQQTNNSSLSKLFPYLLQSAEASILIVTSYKNTNKELKDSEMARSYSANLGLFKLFRVCNTSLCVMIIFQSLCNVSHNQSTTVCFIYEN